jgi:hypothetical protein
MQTNHEKKNYMWRSLLALVAMVAITLSLAACEQEQDQGVAGDEPSLGADSTINPASVLQDMARVLKSTESFTVYVEKVFDEVQHDGSKVQYAGAADVSIRRPDRFHVDYGDDISAKEAWYDGEHFTLLEHLHKVYAQIPAAPPIRNVLNVLENDYDVFLPLAGLFRPDPSKEYGEGALKQRYLGIHDADGWPCHHLWFQGEKVDWQLWIEAGDEPLLRKVVVTYKNVEGSPQHVALLTDWELDPPLDDELFVADLPDDAVRAEVLTKKEGTP